MLLLIFILVIVIKNEMVSNMEGQNQNYATSISKKKKQYRGEPLGNHSLGKFTPVQKKVLDQ